jgi:membrane protease YdiL (CAAX protease family)
MKTTKILNPVFRIWDRLPLIARAIISGFLVSSIGISVWSALLAGFFSPWAILPMIAALWVFWKFFSGKWPLTRRATIRIFNFRSTSLSFSTWKWGLVAAALFVLIVQASFVITFRLVQFPEAQFTADYKALDTLPLWAAFAILAMSSIVAAICEETGFRGYMQAPIEKKYGPVTAIIITSVVFTAIHLSHSWARQIVPQIFFASVLLGILAYKCGSLIPGIIGHAILDVFDYSVWWTDLTGGFQRQPIFKTGIDLHFMIWVLIFTLALFGFFRVLGKFNNANKILRVPSQSMAASNM